MLGNGHRVLAALLATSGLAAALSCGAKSTSSCVDIVAASQPCNNTFLNPCSVTEYFAWPGIFSWDQCQTICQQTESCRSFQYVFVVVDSEAVGEGQQSAPECRLYTHSVSTYIRPCGNGAKTSLATFYDVECPAPTLLTNGAVPAHPSTNPTDGSCGSTIQWSGTSVQLAHISIKGLPANTTQAECSDACKANTQCKSYYWGENFPGYKMYPMSNKETYTSLSEPPPCVLLSQPVSEYTSSKKIPAERGVPFYDRNCPVLE